MKIIDWVIAAAVVACIMVGYSGHRLEAIPLLLLVVILASWRFYDDRHLRGKHGGASGELNPELDKHSSDFDAHADNSGAEVD
jgi:hypothetical protein